LTNLFQNIWISPKTWQNITVKQIVTHKSGLPEIWDSQGNMLSENSETLFQKIKELLLFLNLVKI
jgi:CubicO group peptidase (beta-lactamase class C family)